MIIWLASYPKSGNTLMRSLLSSYFFSKDGTFNFRLLKNIKQYPNGDLLTQLGVNINDPHEIAKSHIRVQEFINKDKNSFKFLKTHSSFVKMDGFSFTDLANTLGAIHIVRDPRDVVLSYSKIKDHPARNMSHALWKWNDSTLSVNVEEIEFDLNYFPNPVSDKLYINYTNDVNISVFDINGRKILQTNNKTIDFSDFDYGIYLLKIKDVISSPLTFTLLLITCVLTSHNNPRRLASVT